MKRRTLHTYFLPSAHTRKVERSHEYSADKLSACGCHVTYTLVDHKWVCFADCCRPVQRKKEKDELQGPRGSVEYALRFLPLSPSLFTSCVYVDVAEKLCLIASIICTGTDNVSIRRFTVKGRVSTTAGSVHNYYRYELV